MFNIEWILVNPSINIVIRCCRFGQSLIVLMFRWTFSMSRGSLTAVWINTSCRLFSSTVSWKAWLPYMKHTVADASLEGSVT